MIVLLFAMRVSPSCLAQPSQEFFQKLQQGQVKPDEFMRQFMADIDAKTKQALADIEITLDEETQYGNDQAADYIRSLERHGLKLVDKGPDVDYVRQLALDLVPRMSHAERYQKLRVFVVQSEYTDARTFPGGTLIFFQGLIDFADSEAALAGVVAHEMSHLDRQHLLLSLKLSRLMEKSQPRANFALPMMAGMGMKPFRPEDEVEADRDATDWLHAAGYDPRELAKLFLQLRERNRRSEQLRAVVPSFLLTHPLEKNRSIAVQARFAELQKDNPREYLYVGRENIKQRIARSQREFDE